MTDPQPDPIEALEALDDEVVEGELLDSEPHSDQQTDPQTDPPGEVTFETLVTDLERVASERDKFLDAWRRAQADFENCKKQAQRRADDELQRRMGSFVERFLPVLDACDAARLHGAG